MPDQIKRYTDPIKARWDLLSKPQRTKLLAVIGVVLLAIILTAWLAFRTQWVTILSNNDITQINPIRAALENEGIRSRVRQHNSALQVDARRKYDALEFVILERTIPNRDNMTWDVALDTGLGTTDSERRRLEILGIQGSIERMLVQQDGVYGARVNLDIPITRPFDRNAPQPRAAVTLEVGSGFSQGQGRSLANIVRMSVSRLELDQIHIIDQHARTVWDGDGENFDLADQANQVRTQHRNFVEATLTGLLSPFADSVGVMYNPWFDETLETEVINTVFSIPEGMDSTGILSRAITERQSMEGWGGGLEPGLPPNTAGTLGYAAGGPSIMSADRRWGDHDYLVNSEVIHTVSGAGWVVPERSTGSVVLTRTFDLRQQDWVADRQAAGYTYTEDDWIRYKHANSQVETVNGVFADFDYVHSLIANAMGLPLSNVSLMIVDQINFIDEVVRIWDWPLILMYVVLFLLIAMLLFGLLRRQRAAGEDEEALEPQLEVENLLVSTQLEHAKEIEAKELEPIDHMKENEMKTNIDKFVNEKPEAVAALLRNWINVEEW